MNLIERAARRLEELRSAGVEIPDDSVSRAPLARAVLGVDALSPGLEAVPDDVPFSINAKRERASGRVHSRSIEFDLSALSASGFISPKAARSQLADEFRLIKRPLLANAFGKSAAPIRNSNLVMVTSALPGEGKTFSAINLAMSIAMELDHTVMLVDADVARPSVLNTLGLPPAPGLLDCLVDRSVDLSDVLLKTNVEKLTLLPSGMQQERATELLASEAMLALLDEMANRYPDRIIVFDSPPLLLTTEARVLATHMGQVVVVVRSEVTSRQNVKDALETIERCPVKLMLLNQARTANRLAYGYGYGYGHEG